MPIGKACPFRGCGRTIGRDQRWCAEHASVMANRERERQRDVDRRRPRDTGRDLYLTPEWRALSQAFLQRRRFCECEWCVEHPEQAQRSEVVDHIRPHLGRPGLFWDQQNWRPMSGPHHSRKTARDDGGFGHPRKASR